MAPLFSCIFPEILFRQMKNETIDERNDLLQMIEIQYRARCLQAGNIGSDGYGSLRHRLPGIPLPDNFYFGIVAIFKAFQQHQVAAIPQPRRVEYFRLRCYNHTAAIACYRRRQGPCGAYPEAICLRYIGGKGMAIVLAKAHL